MTREQNIPFLLWVCAAVLAHITWSAGADRAARLAQELADVRLFARAVHQEIARAEPIEVSLIDNHEIPSPEPEPTAAQPEPTHKPALTKPPEQPDQEKEKPAPAKQEPKKEPNPNKPIILLPSPPAPPSPPPPVKMDHRIAVKQQVKDKNQPDNPNARFVGDEANRTEDETVARSTSHDVDDPNPTFGGQHTGPEKTPGNADQTRVGQSDDHPGEPDHAPGEGSKKDNAPLPAATPAPVPTVQPPARGGGPRPPEQVRPSGHRPQPSPSPTGDQSTNPDVASSQHGAYSLDPRRSKGSAAGSAQAQVPRPTAPAPAVSAFGLGAGPNDRGVQLNLVQKDVVAAVGVDQLRRERASDGERRRSAHRGSWNTSTFERWRPAIENYVSSVRPGNQTALNTARVPFANYLVAIHNRIHPIFADSFLDSLDSFPSNHPMNDMKIFSAVEIVLERIEGRVVKMGVVKTSGIIAFDVAALDSVHRAQPFGKPPDAIVSADGNVYLHWEFHRDPIYACSTMNARPFMLNRPPPIDQPRPPSPPPQPPADPRERGLPPAPSPPAAPDRNHLGERTLTPHRAVHG